MSDENVALVLRLQAPPEMDIAGMFRDEKRTAQVLEVLAPFCHDDFEVIIHSGSEEIRYQGLYGLRAAWLEWTAPWASYRTEIGEPIDAGDRVVLVPRDFGRFEPGGPEVEQAVAAIWTCRDGKVARAEFYSDRGQGLRDAGLAD